MVLEAARAGSGRGVREIELSAERHVPNPVDQGSGYDTCIIWVRVRARVFPEPPAVVGGTATEVGAFAEADGREGR